MHELALCRSLLAEVEGVAAARGAVAVTRIRLRVGPLSGVEPALLERAFLVVRAGSRAAAAALEIEALPLLVRCTACGAEQEAALSPFACARCGDGAVRLLGGDELLVTQVELCADEAAGADPV
jgi:hydrogenase nickel incorporation protein HypA/HybF